MTGNELGLKKFPKLAENYIYESSQEFFKVLWLKKYFPN